jgi:hypothetical protein
MSKLLELSDEKIEQLPAPEMDVVVFASELNECEAGKLCKPELFFEQIEKCALCGKLM